MSNATSTTYSSSAPDNLGADTQGCNPRSAVNSTSAVGGSSHNGNDRAPGRQSTESLLPLPSSTLQVYAFMRGSKSDRGPLYEGIPHNRAATASALSSRGSAASSTLSLQPRWEQSRDHMGLDPDGKIPEFSQYIRGDIPDDARDNDKIMSPMQEDEVYKEFLDYVDDSDGEQHDCDGDPRLNRITASTFLAWSAGAVAGECFYENFSSGTPAMSLPDEDHEAPVHHERPGQAERPEGEKKKRRAKPICIAQYDQGTGEELSPAYSLETVPSPALWPSTPDIAQIPSNFAYTDPTADLAHKKKAFLDADMGHVSPPSSPEVFTDAIIREAFTVDGDPESGIRNTQETADHLQGLMNERAATFAEAHKMATIHTQLKTQVSQLQHDVIILRERVRAKKRDDLIRRRHAEQVNELMEGVYHEIGKARMTVQAFEEASGKLREAAGGLLAERKQLEEELGDGFKQLEGK